MKEKPVEKMTRQDMSERFMEVFNIQKDFGIDSRKKLFACLVEEIVELGTSLGVRRNEINSMLKNVKQTEYHPAGDKVGVLDSLIDAEFFMNQIKVISGIEHRNFILGYRRVYEANMNKLHDGKVVYHDGTEPGVPKGKVKKPDGWKPADLSDLV